MDKLQRGVLLLVGVVLGFSLGAPYNHLIGAALGALAAFGLAELIDLRARVRALQTDVARLQKAQPQPAASDSAQVPTATTERTQIEVPTPTPPPRVIAEPDIAEFLTDERNELPQSVAPLESTVPLESAVPLATAASGRPVESPVVQAVLRFFTSGNTVVRAGVVILFFGIAFLLRYMAQHTHVPVEVRLTGIALGAIVLLVLGWRLRMRRAGYALALQGGGVGILYLTVFAALRLYAILPVAAAFPLLAVVAALSALLAIKQDSMSLALLGITGGFLAPVLASTGEGSHVVLFSYYALLNAGIFAMAWYKTWRPLNVAGFVFTFAIGTAWGVLRYRPDAFASTEPFLILFFLFYFAIGILFSVRQANIKRFLDGTLIFGTPIVVFSLQSSMLSSHLLSLAFSAVIMSAVYLMTAWILGRRRTLVPALVIDAFIAIGVAFLTLAIPLALDARWNAAAWALEGAALIWLGCRQDRVLPRISGVLLILASECITTFGLNVSVTPFVLTWQSYFDILLQSAAAIFAALTLHAYRARARLFEQVFPHALFWLSLFGWFCADIGEISAHWPLYSIAGWLGLGTLTSLVCSELYRRTRFNDAKVAALLQLPLMLAVAAFSASQLQPPFMHLGWLAWPIAFGGLALAMYRHEGAADAPLATCLHTGASWLFCALCGWQLAWSVDSVIAGAPSWPTAAWAVIPALFLFALPSLTTRVAWPFVKNRDVYLFVAGGGVAVFLCLWSVWTSLTSTGDSAPLPFVPLLNPQDIAQGTVLLILARHWMFSQETAKARIGIARNRLDARVPIPLLAALGFIWLTAALLRTLHQFFGVALDPSSLIDSTLVQTSLSIFWTIIAVVTMLLAARRRRRNFWIAGASLLGIVIAKLFLVDLSRTGSIERIVSFVAVGLLMLVIGYISPLPPTQEKST